MSKFKHVNLLTNCSRDINFSFNYFYLSIYMSRGIILTEEFSCTQTFLVSNVDKSKKSISTVWYKFKVRIKMTTWNCYKIKIKLRVSFDKSKCIFLMSTGILITVYFILSVYCDAIRQNQTMLIYVDIMLYKS